MDLHAITVAYEPRDLPRTVHDTMALLCAAGLDPERCILFRQSDVINSPAKEVLELPSYQEAPLA